MKIFNRIAETWRAASARWDSFTLDDHNWNPLGWSNASGINVTPEYAKRCTTVFSCVRLLSEVIAHLPCKLTWQDDDGDTNEARQDPLFNALAYSPNAWQTAFDYWKWNIECLAYRGWFISIILYSGNGKVNGLLPLHPDSVTVKQNPDGSLYFKGKGMIGPNKSINMENIKPEQIFYCTYATTDGVTPVSPITYNAETIGLALQAVKHGAAFLKNDATPPLAIEYPNAVSPESLKLLAKDWKKGGTGDSYGSPRVLDRGAKLNKISMSNSDAQYLEVRQFGKEEICGIFGVPVHMISDTKQSKGWSTVEMQGIDFVSYTINPWTYRIEQSIRKQLIPRQFWGRKEARFNTNALMRGDLKSRVIYYDKMKQMGAMNANDIRRKENMNLRKDPGGDMYWIPANINVDNGENNNGGESNEQV